MCTHRVSYNSTHNITDIAGACTAEDYDDDDDLRFADVNNSYTS
jgi:hypothetical protein